MKKAPKDIQEVFVKLGYTLGALCREDVTEYLVNQVGINEVVLDQITDGINYIHRTLMRHPNHQGTHDGYYDNKGESQ